MDSLGDRQKNNYENRAKNYLTRRTPVAVRVDGRSFSKFTKNMKKPFDGDLQDAMFRAAVKVADDMQGFKIGYVQSDEASFILTDYDELQTDAWFDYNQSKVETSSASRMTAFFNMIYGDKKNNYFTACFDGRAWNLPESEIANYLLWRSQDWARNSLSMYCRSFFSTKDLNEKGYQQRHDMLASIGKNWATDCSDQEKNGTFIFREDGIIKSLNTVTCKYPEVSNLVDRCLFPLKEEE